MHSNDSCRSMKVARHPSINYYGSPSGAGAEPDGERLTAYSVSAEGVS